jgi:hypothetical protein
MFDGLFVFYVHSVLLKICILYINAIVIAATVAVAENVPEHLEGIGCDSTAVRRP